MKARENPFCVDRVLKLRYRPQDWSWDEFDARLVALNYRGAIVGHEGAGKTTLLEDLHGRLENHGWMPYFLRLSQEQRSFESTSLRRFARKLHDRHIILLDGAEQLTWWRWHAFLRKTRHAGGLIMTCHQPGRLPTIVECRTTLELSEQLIGELVGDLDARRRAELRDLYVQHAGNVREVMRSLYDSWEFTTEDTEDTERC